MINLNDLANALKPVFLPGEHIEVRIVKAGEEPGQGVGYLEDGTMVVVEAGREHIGQQVSIAVTSVLQTSAGRMVFGRYEFDPPPGEERVKPGGGRRTRVGGRGRALGELEHHEARVANISILSMSITAFPSAIPARRPPSPARHPPAPVRHAKDFFAIC